LLSWRASIITQWLISLCHKINGIDEPVFGARQGQATYFRSTAEEACMHGPLAMSHRILRHQLLVMCSWSKLAGSRCYSCTFDFGGEQESRAEQHQRWSKRVGNEHPPLGLLLLQRGKYSRASGKLPGSENEALSAETGVAPSRREREMASAGGRFLEVWQYSRVMSRFATSVCAFAS
jgi:hypothetical protein